MNPKSTTWTATFLNLALSLCACSSPRPTEDVVSSETSALTTYTSGSTNNCSTMTLSALYGASGDTALSNTIYGYLNAALAELNSSPSADAGDSYYPTLYAACGGNITASQSTLNTGHTTYDAYHLDNPTVATDSFERMNTLIKNLAACGPAVAIDSTYHPSTTAHSQNMNAYVHRAVELANQAAYKAEYCYMADESVSINSSNPAGSFSCSSL